MEAICTPWASSSCRFGNAAVLAFLVLNTLDGIFTYLGVKIWGPGIEANPIVSSAVASVGLGAGLMTAKLLAAGFAIVLHLRRVHHLVALLAAIYLCAAILPWTALFLAAS